jgi:hypothetical protein
MIFRKSIKRLLILTILIISQHSYSAEYVDIGYRDGLVIETTVNVVSFLYLVSERSEKEYSYGAGVGYQGNYYSGVISFSQAVGEIKQYKTEAQLNYSDGHFNCFVAIGLQTERTDLIYRIGAGYPIGGKTSITAYFSDKGFFFGIRRTL